LHECETWCLAFRGKRRLRVSENRMLMKIFGPTREKDLRKLNNKELHNFYASQNVITVIKSTGLIFKWFL
jgi:hypothetical protein